jgi:hypothetical protein
VNEIPSRIASLFEREPALCGFSVRGADQVPDSCPREDDDDPLFVGDVGISPLVDAEQYLAIFKEVVATVTELLAEEPQAAAVLRGRTFARVLH